MVRAQGSLVEFYCVPWTVQCDGKKALEGLLFSHLCYDLPMAITPLKHINGTTKK